MTLKLWNAAIAASIAVVTILATAVHAQQKPAIRLDPSKMRKIGSVDPRFLSYNVEMVEVTGGRFWKPYKSAGQPAANSSTTAQGNQPPGMSPDLYEYRQPIDLSNPRLRKLAQALGPAYVRVSGTWQNSTYFQNDDNPPPAQAPQGFKGVLTRAEWKGVVDFAQAVDDKIVTSFAISAGTRDPEGVWTPAQAKAFLKYTRSIGGSIAAAEFMNEPTFPGPGGAPAGYDAAAFARDAKVFAQFLRGQSPQTVFLGPGGVGEGVSMMPGGIKMKLLESEDLLKATGSIFDAFSYHFYGGVSRRCTGNVTVAQALSPEWLDRTAAAHAFYAGLRDKYTPGKPMWLTETAEAACGGDQFAGEFADTFRFLNQLGTLAQKGVQVVMHNTLAASDYGLLDESTLEPRPDYWAAFLWKRLMGAVVLDPGVAGSENLRVFAHCAQHQSGGVALVLLNTDPEHAQTVTLGQPGERLTLTAADLTSSKTMVNGVELAIQADGSLPNLPGEKVAAGPIPLPPASATFVLMNGARNQSCR
jgi:heparanase